MESAGHCRPAQVATTFSGTAQQCLAAPFHGLIEDSFDVHFSDGLTGSAAERGVSILTACHSLDSIPQDSIRSRNEKNSP